MSLIPDGFGNYFTPAPRSLWWITLPKNSPRGKPVRPVIPSVWPITEKKMEVCIEANVAPKLWDEAWSQGRIPELRAYGLLKAEVPLNRHTRFVFQAQGSIPPGKKAWIEVKCVTLVDDQGLGRFPDAPSDRASKHLRELMFLSRGSKTECFVFFILQNETGRAVGPKDDTDPLFGKTLRAAARSKVRLLAWRARIDLKGARLDKALRLDLKFPASNGARASKAGPEPTKAKVKARTRIGVHSCKPAHN